MAYEGSEIATAAALMFKTEELTDLKTKFEGRDTEDKAHLEKTLKEAIKRVKSPTYKSKTGQIVFGPGGAEAGFMKLLNPKSKESLIDFAKGISAAISIRKYIRGKRGDSSPTKKVFMTGGTWPKEVEKFSLAEGNFNYNSADILVNNSTSTKKEKYYGISLKKKSSKAAAPPPLINKSLEKVINDDPVFTKLLNDLNEFKYKYFADNLKKVISTDKRTELKEDGKLLYLDGFSLPNSNEEIFNCTIKHPFKGGNVRLISLKGMGVVRKKLDKTKDKILANQLFAIGKDGKLLPKSKWQMRQYMNKTLYGGSSNPYWKKVLETLNTQSERLAEVLVDVILKINLYNKLKVQDVKKSDFDFQITTGIGNVTPKGDVTIGDATTYPFKTLLCGYSRIQKHKDFVGTKWGLVIQQEEDIKKNKEKMIEEEEEEAKDNDQRAQIKFWLKKGKLNVLDLVLRYKGRLGQPPQFTGTLHQNFIDLLNDECGKTV